MSNLKPKLNKHNLTHLSNNAMIKQYYLAFISMVVKGSNQRNQWQRPPGCQAWTSVCPGPLVNHDIDLMSLIFFNEIEQN